jgi:hypothetical protein
MGNGCAEMERGHFPERIDQRLGEATDRERAVWSVGG